MTVLTAVAPQKEKEANTVSDKSNVLLLDNAFCVESDTNDVLLKVAGGATLARVIAPKRRCSTRCRQTLFFLLVFSLMLLVASVIVGMIIYKNRHLHRPRRVFCNIQYPGTASSRRRRSFKEEVEVHPTQEWLKVPQMRRPRSFIWVIHLFRERQTILKMQHVCLIKPMRPDLSMPRNPDQLMRSLLSGKLRPFARNRREDWEIEGPPIPSKFLENFMSGPILHICRGLPVYHMVPSRIKEMVDRPFRRHNCPMLKCRACPSGFHMLRNQLGCQTCQCADKNNFCEKDSACDIACPRGHKRDPDTGCKLCDCKIGGEFVRNKREAVTNDDKPQQECPIADVTFEGMPITDEEQTEGIMVTDYIRTCDPAISALLKN